MSTVPPMTEAMFQTAVIALARSLGWGVSAAAWKRLGEELATFDPTATNNLEGLIFHPRFSVGSESGWPDLCLMRRRGGRVLFRELKSDKGAVSPRQAAVLDLMTACGLDAAVWRPADMPRIAEELL